MKLKFTQVKGSILILGTCIFSLTVSAQSPAIPNAGFETRIDQGQYDDPEKIGNQSIVKQYRLLALYLLHQVQMHIAEQKLLD